MLFHGGVLSLLGSGMKNSATQKKGIIFLRMQMEKNLSEDVYISYQQLGDFPSQATC